MVSLTVFLNKRLQIKDIPQLSPLPQLRQLIILQMHALGAYLD